MNVANFPNFYNIQQKQAQQSAPMDQLVSMLNDKAERQSPLEAAKQALLDAKTKLDGHRNEKIENALSGYRALRSRQTSYKDELDVQQKQLENFQTLSSRRDELTNELSAARADYEAYAATETTLDITQHNRLSLRVSSLENELASVNHDITALVEQANRYTNSQRQYTDYLKNTNQSGYAAYEYQSQTEYTEENFVSQTTSMIDRMETGAKQWRDRVSSYCEEYGLTPYDFESYLQERNKLTDAYFAAQQRVSELLYAAGGATAGEAAKQKESTQVSGTLLKDSFDTVEISDSALKQFQQKPFF
ncbi:hypothetical protein D1159_13715 [Pseudoflavonifractor sp. 524-17]|uniref:hypothetical protein n=1 Tax=Pseudoflavonifractor sp. 524-17 TaxID=2304577 RepID=UPI00137A1FB0|nr:hypothetical protein [Pseudoflavonifractor sp. 524-17]NCE65607.1 hypothetical protein [Pseudoflavonifractor sp. 524-17]